MIPLLVVMISVYDPLCPTFGPEGQRSIGYVLSVDTIYRDVDDGRRGHVAWTAPRAPVAVHGTRSRWPTT
jgi:hypothetical protein